MQVLQKFGLVQSILQKTKTIGKSSALVGYQVLRNAPEANSHYQSIVKKVGFFVQWKNRLNYTFIYL
jgi:hypothetical protein